MTTSSRIVLALFALAVMPWTARAQSPGPADEAGVRAALQHYLNGHATGSQDEMRQAFHPDARMTFVRDGKVVITPIAEYIARFTGQAAPDEPQRKRRITHVEVTGNAATGRIELDYPTAFIVDYMTLLKDDGRWVIIAKSFQSTPRAR